MGLELVVLHEGVLIEEELDTLSGSKLALLVLHSVQERLASVLPLPISLLHTDFRCTCFLMRFSPPPARDLAFSSASLTLKLFLRVTTLGAALARHLYNIQCIQVHKSNHSASLITHSCVFRTMSTYVMA